MNYRLLRKNISRRGLPFVILLIFWPLMLPAQNGITISDFAMKAGTIIFNVSWNKNNMPKEWNDTAWVFVDYNDEGTMKRLPLAAGATLTATSAPGIGKVEPTPNNNKGVWVVGNARTAGAFSATVQLLTATANLSGMCVYAINYPPVGKYTSDTTIAFKGTPKYVVTLNNGQTVTAMNPYTVPAGRSIVSFTDASLAPGVINCITPAAQTLTASASSFCMGTGGVQFALLGTDQGALYRLFKDGAPTRVTLSGNGSAATFSQKVDTAGVYTAWMEPGVYCSAEMKGAHTLTASPAPAAPTGTPGVRCGGGSLNISAVSDGALIDWYSVASSGTVLPKGQGREVFYTIATYDEATTYYAEARYRTTGCVSTVRTPVLATINYPPQNIVRLTTDISTICKDVPTAVTLTAIGGSMGSGAVYVWGTGLQENDTLSPATTTAATRVVTPSAEVTYWAKLKGNTACTNNTEQRFAFVKTYPEFGAGEIASAGTAIPVGIDPGFHLGTSSLVNWQGGSGSVTNQWRRTGTSSATLTGNWPEYLIYSDSSNYKTVGIYYINRYVRDVGCKGDWMPSAGTYTLTVSAPCTLTWPGNCYYCLPDPIGTFQDFSATYNASTYIALVDARDSQTYTVVKLGNRWLMAQNLNYQKDLIWEANANSPSAGNDRKALIGHFWCPGGHSAATPTSTRVSCDVWGALYSWETAMMVDGKWTSDAHTGSDWVEPFDYATEENAGNSQNHGRAGSGATSNGRGICPQNWHVPTDEEWGDLLNAMEPKYKEHNTGHYSNTEAGGRGKSKCIVADQSEKGDKYVNDKMANWYYHVTSLGTDDYKLRILPAGSRSSTEMKSRGSGSFFFSSSAYHSTGVWCRQFHYMRISVERGVYSRSSGNPVRCINDL
jgi:uncharacterized protein (TIGR02145 family)